MSSAIFRISATRNGKKRAPRNQKKPNALYHIIVRPVDAARRAPTNRRSDFYASDACPNIVVNPQRDFRAINQFKKSK